MIKSMGNITSQRRVFNSFKEEEEDLVEGEVNRNTTSKLAAYNRCQWVEAEVEEGEEVEEETMAKEMIVKAIVKILE